MNPRRGWQEPSAVVVAVTLFEGFAGTAPHAPRVGSAHPGLYSCRLLRRLCAMSNAALRQMCRYLSHLWPGDQRGASQNESLPKIMVVAVVVLHRRRREAWSVRYSR